MAETILTVSVVSADRVVWEGEATSVVARTTEGDIGILPRHEPMLAALVPCAAEIVGTNGTRYIVAVDGGFISVDNNRVSLLSQYARLGDEVDAADAEKRLHDARATLAVDATDGHAERQLRRATAEMKAVEKSSGRS